MLCSLELVVVTPKPHPPNLSLFGVTLRWGPSQNILDQALSQVMKRGTGGGVCISIRIQLYVSKFRGPHRGREIRPGYRGHSEMRVVNLLEF